jgi:hypothetical protein
VELPLGWNETRQAIRFDAAARPHAIVRKDWSGVIIEAQPGAELTINDEPLAGARRLRDGDRVALAAPEAAAGAAGAVLIFHEPASLIVLDSLFSQKIPPPVVSAQAANHRRAETGPAGAHDAPRARRAPDLANDRKYFGVFTQLEMLAMGVSTLLLSVLIFLMLSIFAGP